MMMQTIFFPIELILASCFQTWFAFGNHSLSTRRRRREPKALGVAFWSKRQALE
jgi:hypothetical protein